MGAQGAGMGLQAGAGLASAFIENEARGVQNDFDNRQLELEAQIADDNAREVAKTLKKRITSLRRSTNKLKGAQRASLASQGIDIETGSALDIQLETEELASIDELNLRNDAMREAYGFKSEAVAKRSGIEFNNIATDQANFTTILTAGLGAGSSALQIAGKTGAFKSKAGPKQLPNQGDPPWFRRF